MINKKIAALTLGCKVNSSDTESIVSKFLQEGYELVDFSEKADVYIINTCTVTNIGDKKSRQMIRKAVETNKDAIVVATGCYSQVNPESVKAIEGVSIVLGTKDRLKIFEAVKNFESNKNNIFSVENIMEETEFENTFITHYSDKTRAYLKVQDGCEMFCSYCIIPFARGRVRSRKREDVLEQVRAFAKDSFKEIVLAGIHIASYGKDLEGTDLLSLINEVSLIDGIERIRFSSLEPTLITEQFAKTLSQNEKICNHFHLSLQSGCNKTLKEMNRKYTKEQYSEAVSILRSYFKNVSLTTDVIVGFPNESEEDFIESYEFVEQMKLSKLHVFPFSKKEGTRASKLKNQIPSSIKNERSKKMLQLSADLEREFLESQKDSEFSVLIESEVENGVFCGYSTNYIKCLLKSEKNIINKIFECTYDKIIDDSLFVK